jgi:hypothetical protein
MSMILFQEVGKLKKVTGIEMKLFWYIYSKTFANKSYPAVKHMSLRKASRPENVVGIFSVSELCNNISESKRTVISNLDRLEKRHMVQRVGFAPSNLGEERKYYIEFISDTRRWKPSI